MEYLWWVEGVNAVKFRWGGYKPIYFSGCCPYQEQWLSAILYSTRKYLNHKWRTLVRVENIVIKLTVRHDRIFFTCFSALYQLNPLSANLTKWPNTFKQFVGQQPTNCLSVFNHFVWVALKGLIVIIHVIRKLIAYF